MSVGFRLATGGLIDRARPLDFSFDGLPMTGFDGDTIASALLANGVMIVGRSLKGHRPRGVVSAGVEEPNALVSVEGRGFIEPMARATEIPLRQGMRVRSLNAWPNVHVDLGAVMGAGAALTVAGFYYKTFKWPRWSAYERLIRRAAGLGRLPRRSGREPAPHAHESVDVLIVGGGPAGIAAAETLAGSDLQVVLVEARGRLGGSLSRQETIAGEAGGEWLRQSEDLLARAGNVAVGRHIMVAGAYAGNVFVLEEKDGQGGHRLYQLTAGQVVLATGSIEQPLLFANNDRPGVMLAGAVRRYLEDFAVVPGRRGVVFTSNDFRLGAGARAGPGRRGRRCSGRQPTAGRMPPRSRHRSAGSGSALRSDRRRGARTGWCPGRLGGPTGRARGDRRMRFPRRLRRLAAAPASRRPPRPSARLRSGSRHFVARQLAGWLACLRQCGGKCVGRGDARGRRCGRSGRRRGARSRRAARLRSARPSQRGCPSAASADASE